MPIGNHEYIHKIKASGITHGSQKEAKAASGFGAVNGTPGRVAGAAYSRPTRPTRVALPQCCRITPQERARETAQPGCRAQDC